ncbi:MAG TPA: sigma-70 family RNA polymerase sigma factor [Pyrinomonadaceae bacterium]
MSILDSIARASDTRSPLPARHEAFAELVHRFQDMAFACAYSVLGDAYLAEDVAQESFVTAWQKLDQLRDPRAFPGWFKRIVLSQCNRLTRGKRLQVVPLIAGADTSAANDAGPDVVVEKQQLLNKVLVAIKALPENQRLVTTLFYVNGYTQADISDFLEVPVSTVNKRLHVARNKLKESVQVFKETLHHQRPSRNRDFVERVSASLRPPVDGDWLAINRMVHERVASDALSNELWTHRRQSFDEQRYVRRQYVAEDANSKQILGYGSIEQTVYLPRYRLIIVADPQHVSNGIADLILDRLLTDLIEVNAVTVSCREHASQTQLFSFLKDRGFTEVETVLDLRLDVTGVDASRLKSVSESVEGQGVIISTLAEELMRDPNCVEKLYALSTALHQDDPARSPLAPPGYNAREAGLWLDMPYVLPNAYFIARQGDQYVGVSGVSLFEALPGGLTQSFTGVIRERRRQGIATALMLRAINYAALHNYQLIQSFTRPIQSAMLVLNRKLGFQELSGSITLEKCLRETVSVASNIYDEYAGHYRDDERRPDLEIIVSNEGGRLTGECNGQKIELFPTSETEFFVKEFYGDATFIRDEAGRVSGLDFVMPDYHTRKRSVQHARRIS